MKTDERKIRRQYDAAPGGPEGLTALAGGEGARYGAAILTSSFRLASNIKFDSLSSFS